MTCKKLSENVQSVNFLSFLPAFNFVVCITALIKERIVFPDVNGAVARSRQFRTGPDEGRVSDEGENGVINKDGSKLQGLISRQAKPREWGRGQNVGCVGSLLTLGSWSEGMKG